MAKKTAGGTYRSDSKTKAGTKFPSAGIPKAFKKTKKSK
jgi:hypothetical protein